MRENELAELMFRMAADRGVGAEAAADELASIAMPSFVDARAFRSAVILTLESSLRAQVEERLQSIRKKFDMAPGTPASPAAPLAGSVAHHPAPSSTPAPATPMDGFGDLADATIADFGTPAEAAAPEATAEEELPADATMVWTTRHG